MQGTASFATSATSASYADNANLLNGLNSSTFTSTASFQNYTSSTDASISSINTTTASLNAAISSLNAATSSLYTTTASLNTRVGTLEAYTSSLNAKTSSFATTGSNTFNGTQTITGSLNISGNIVTPGTITAQTLIVQTITSSQDFVTGSTKFGTISANTHQFTGSVSITGSLNVNGPLTATSLTGSLGGSNLVDASVANTKLTNSSVTINGTSLSLGGTLTQAQTIAGAFSGSAQIDHNATTNYVANRHIDHTAVSISAGNGLSGGGDISSTRTISLDTTSATFTNGVKSKLNADGVVSSSAQIDHNATTNYVANRHIDHSAVSISAGSGLTGGGDITTTRTLSIATGGVTNAMLTNSTISGIALGSNLATLTIGTGLSGTSYNGSGAVTIANTGVTSAVAGTAISVSGATGAVTITNTGVTSNVAGTGVSVSGATGAVTISIGQAVGTGANVQFNSLGVGTAGSATAGEIRATNDITAFYSSDERLKENITLIENPIEKLMSIDGVTFNWKEGFDEVHSHKGADTGVIAQQIEAIGLPEVVTTRENGFKAVKYEKLNALLIEGFKQQQVLIQSQQIQIDELKTLVNQLLNK